MDEYDALLRQIEQNDPTVDKLAICDAWGPPTQGFKFVSPECPVDFFAQLGTAIGRNTKLTYLHVDWNRAWRKIANNPPFIDGFRQHSSYMNTFCLESCNLARIYELITHWDCYLNLQDLYIDHCVIDQEGMRWLTYLIRQCDNLRVLAIISTAGMRQHLPALMAAVRECRRLRQLRLNGNHVTEELIERGEYEALISPLLQDRTSNLRALSVGLSSVDSDSLAGSLVGNTKLKTLMLLGGDDGGSIGDFDLAPFKKLLCDTTSMDATYYSSNHTLRRILPSLDGTSPEELAPFLELNRSSWNKTEVAIRKILHFHPQFNVEPLFEWDMKVLPILLGWFERARSSRLVEGELVDNRKLCATFQFIRGMPYLSRPRFFCCVCMTWVIEGCFNKAECECCGKEICDNHATRCQSEHHHGVGHFSLHRKIFGCNNTHLYSAEECVDCGKVCCRGCRLFEWINGNCSGCKNIMRKRLPAGDWTIGGALLSRREFSIIERGLLDRVQR